MATELGQAYVQIMPSAKGISGSIQKTINPEATAAGKSAGSRIATSIASSMGKAGKTLTKAITLPAVGAAAAVGGIVAAFGWKRLVGLDSARAQLQGLGYDAKSVDRISDLVNKSIQGTVTTMAEGVSIAAGGLAAGVKEGAELEKYIQLVGDAAVGANRPVNDMAQIFNRVQGSGKLMTQELNMIEDGMPGFAMAMSKSLGVPQEEFRKMVTAGKVSSEDFLKVMDSFAGEMSGAYANSWQGMVSNTKAWIGIIGENILSGVFEQSKESIAEFMQFLKSDDVQTWAKEMGATVGEAFGKLIETVKDVINWWTNLDGGTQKLIGTLAGVAVAIGPILMILSKLITAITVIAGAISTPVLIAVGVIAGLIAVGVLLYKNWDTIKAKAIEVFSHFTPLLDTMKESFGTMMESVGPILESLKTLWESLVPILELVGAVVGGVLVVAFGIVISTIAAVISAIGPFINAIINIADIVANMVNVVVALLTGDFAGAWDYLGDIAESTKDFFVNIFTAIGNFIGTFVSTIIDFFHGLYMTLVGNSIIPDIVNEIVDWFKNMVTWVVDLVKKIISGVVAGFTAMSTAISAVMSAIRNVISSVWNAIRSVINSVVNGIRSVVTSVFNAVRSTISSVMNGIRSNISSVWNGIRSVISSVVNAIRSVISSVFNGLKGIVSSAMGGVKNAVSTGIKGALNVVTNLAGNFKNAGRKIVTSIAEGITGAIGKVTGAISNVTSKIRDFLPFSPPKTGPLIDIMDVKWGETIAGGIDKGEGTVAKAMDSLLDFDLTKKANFHNSNGFSNSGQNDVTQLLLELIDAVKDGQNISLFPNGGTFAKKTGDYTSQEGGNRIRRHERGLA